MHIPVSEWDWLLNVTCNNISVIYVTAYRCAGGLKKKLDLRSFCRVFNVPVQAPTWRQPFYGYAHSKYFHNIHTINVAEREVVITAPSWRIPTPPLVIPSSYSPSGRSEWRVLSAPSPDPDMCWVGVSWTARSLYSPQDFHTSPASYQYPCHVVQIPRWT